MNIECGCKYVSKYRPKEVVEVIQISPKGRGRVIFFRVVGSQMRGAFYISATDFQKRYREMMATKKEEA